MLALHPREGGVFELRAVCQHGTYGKEWISGDEGRTTPSLASRLGAPGRCCVLDLEVIAE